MPLTPPHSHLILPFAASLSDLCQQALPHLDQVEQLPHLHQLLQRLRVSRRFEADEYALSMPHEQVVAQLLGWGDMPDGTHPWAAYEAQQLGIQTADQAWGWISPCHWLMGRETLTLIDPHELQLSESDSRELLEVLRPWFEDEGWQLLYAAPTRWYAAHPSLQNLPTASLDRVIGRNPDLWMPDHPQARLIKRLQNEVQMLMYQHPFNEAREQKGSLSVNSFWLSGCGQLAQIPPPSLPSGVQVLNSLRAPLLASNMSDWMEAWHRLDASVFKDACHALDAGHRLELSLCGDRHAVTLSTQNNPTSIFQRLKHTASAWLAPRRPVVSPLLASL